MTKELKFSIDDLTFGQLEFLTDYTGRSAEEMTTMFRDGTYNGRDLVAILALASNPDDPKAGLETVRNIKASEIELNFEKNDN